MNIVNDSNDLENELEDTNKEPVSDERKVEAETPIEFNQYLIEPTGEKLFYWITKDITLTYLDELDLERIRMLCQLIVTLHQIGLHKCSVEFYGDLSAIVNTARARHGFERQMEQTNIGKTFQYFDKMEENKLNRGEQQ